MQTSSKLFSSARRAEPEHHRSRTAKRRAALLLATALTSGCLLSPVWLVAVARAADDIVGDQTVIGGGGGGTLGDPYVYTSRLNVGGSAGNGSVTVTAGGTMSSTSSVATYIGTNTGRVGGVTVSGTNSSWTSNHDFYIGFSGGTGTLNLTDGGSITGAYFSVGALSGVGTVIVDGGFLTATINDMRVGLNGTGVLTLAGGGEVTVNSGSGRFIVGGSSGSANGTLNIGAAAGDAAATPGTMKAATITLESGSGKLVLNHSGTNYVLAPNIAGGGTVEQYSGTTILTGTNTYTGSTTISGGTLQIGNGGTSGSVAGNITNNAVLIFNRSDALSYSGVISGSGSLTKSGAGNLTLTGANTYSGGTTISGGTLSVNGSLAGTVSVLSGGTLGGTGTLGGVAVSSGATLAPGNSIGTLNVAGNASFASASTYAVEVDSAGNSDKMVATGTVTIDPGATLSIGPENGTDDGSTYAISTDYTILAAASISGTFGTVMDSFAYLDASVSYAATSATLTLLRNNIDFAALAETPNQRSVAGAVNSLGSADSLFVAVLGLPTGEPADAFRQLSGEGHSSRRTATMQRAGLTRGVITNRIRDAFDGVGSGTGTVAAYGEGDVTPVMPEDERFTVWSAGFGGRGHLNSDGNAAAFDGSGAGVLIGADMVSDNGWRLGLAGGYSAQDFGSGATGFSGRSDSYHLAAYGGTALGPLGLRFGAVYSHDDIATNRTVSFAGLSDSLTADYAAGTYQGFAELGWRIDRDLLHIEPFAGLSYVDLRTDAFTEKGGAASLSSDAGAERAAYATIGARIDRDIAIEGMPGKIYASATWQHVIGGNEVNATMRFASGGNVFSIAGTPIDRDTARIDLGFSLDAGRDLVFKLGYQGEFGANARRHTGQLGLNYSF